jgi:c-di-GMP phosphodiesterase
MIERDAVDARVGAGLKELRRRGYRIAIDDFGTGQSSLSVLAKIECDRLKIDREFVRAIDEDASNRPVLDAIIDLARRLNLPTIAEGVETQAQRAYLSAQGVGALQGYLIARPMAVADFVIWLGDNQAWARSADEARRIGQLSSMSQADAG